MNQELILCFHASEIHRCSNKNFSWIRVNYSELLILPLTMELKPSPESWAIERQNNQVKHCVSNSLINLHSGVFMYFSNRTQRSFCMILSKVARLYYSSQMHFSFSLSINIWGFKKWVANLTKSMFKAREKDIILMDQELRTLQFVTPAGML